MYVVRRINYRASWLGKFVSAIWIGKGEYEYEYEIFIASGTNIKYMETTYNKDWQTYINRNSTKAKD